MVPCPPSFTAHRSGDRSVFVLPAAPVVAAGAAAAASLAGPQVIIRYRERVRPVRRLLDVARSIVEGDPDFVPATFQPAELIKTAEGEYAALVVLDGSYRGQPARRFVGSVLTEDFATELDVLALVPERFAALHKLALSLLMNDTLQLGVRPRRFLYTPPPGWNALLRGLSATYYPPEFPQVLAELTVPPAEPQRRSLLVVYAAIAQADAAAGLTTEHEFGPDPVSSDHGLRGRQWYTILKSPAQTRLYRYVVLFQDDHYTYTLRLQSDSQAHLSAQHKSLVAVCRSVHPLPAVDPKTARPHVPGGIWID